MKALFVAVLLPMLFVAGCEKAPSSSLPAEASTTAPRTGQGANAIQAQSTAQLRTDPASLANCTAAAVNVIWDLSATHPGENAVEIWVGTGASAKMFAAGGNKGEAMTGAWSTPGATFSLRLPNTTQALSQAVVGGPSCPSAG